MRQQQLVKDQLCETTSTKRGSATKVFVLDVPTRFALRLDDIMCLLGQIAYEDLLNMVSIRTVP